MREICSALPLAGDAGLRRLSELRSSYDPCLKCVFPAAAEAVNEMEGLAAWMVDKAIKNCLDVMWRIRVDCGKSECDGWQVSCLARSR
jgi:hypothetical protein